MRANPREPLVCGTFTALLSVGIVPAVMAADASQRASFPSTRWTLILSARESPDRRRAALNELLASYWRPLYSYARRKGCDPDAAQDVVQGFVAHLLGRDFLSRLDPARGRLRSYLRTSLDNYLAYHLEHHLYPQVPSHNLPLLSQRLEPVFRDAGVIPTRVP